MKNKKQRIMKENEAIRKIKEGYLKDLDEDNKFRQESKHQSAFESAVEDESLVSRTASTIDQAEYSFPETSLNEEVDVKALSGRVEFLSKKMGDLNVIGWGQRGMSYGSGEVRLENLDDVDKDSAKVNGKYLKYNAATDSWVGASAGSGGGGDDVDLSGYETHEEAAEDDAETLVAAKVYTDEQIASHEPNAPDLSSYETIEQSQADDAETLVAANVYTDEQIASHEPGAPDLL